MQIFTKCISALNGLLILWNFLLEEVKRNNYFLSIYIFYENYFLMKVLYHCLFIYVY